jgi:CheY-like chemotaxis protein
MTAPRPGKEATVAGNETIVLLAEDDPGYRLLVATILSHLGYEVIEAANSDDLLSKASEADVLVVDTHLPPSGVRGGIEAVRRLWKSEEHGEARPVVFISALPKESCADSLTDLQDRFFWLQKPFDGSLLHKAIQEVAIWT